MVQTAPRTEEVLVGTEVAAEDMARAAVYDLLSAFLSTEPTPEMLQAVSDLEAPDTEFGRALSKFSSQARASDPEDLRDNFFELFVGVGRGLLVPYGSYYLTGFLNEKPLAKLRSDMKRMGLEREDGVNEPEDHVASVLQIMSGLVSGAFVADGEDRDTAARAFFESHIAPWAKVFFDDLAATNLAPFYTSLGQLGSAFIKVEVAAIEYGS